MESEGVIEKIKTGVQKCGPIKIGIMILCGVLLLVISYLEPSSSVVEEKGQVKNVKKTTGSDSLQDYRKTMEDEVGQVLSQVEGVGKVDVMLTLKASKEKVTLKDTKVDTGKSEEESVLVEDEDHNTSPYVIQEREPEIEGIVVVCSGGDIPRIQREIIDAISALFSVESHKIKVMKSKEAK
nr:stage III sporulation protein AG [Eubacterium sp.]